MNHKIVITSLLLGISSLAATANSEPINACALLQAENLAPWGYDAAPRTAGISQTSDKAAVGASSDVQSDICSLNSASAEQRGTAFIVVESFIDDIGAEAMASWIKIVAARAKEQDVKNEEVQIGDTHCETGEYPVPVADGKNVIEHYVACDRMVGARHLTVNFQQPDTARLPTPPQVKELVDQAAARLTLPPLKAL